MERKEGKKEEKKDGKKDERKDKKQDERKDKKPTERKDKKQGKRKGKEIETRLFVAKVEIEKRKKKKTKKTKEEKEFELCCPHGKFNLWMSKQPLDFQKEHCVYCPRCGHDWEAHEDGDCGEEEEEDNTIYLSSSSSSEEDETDSDEPSVDNKWRLLSGKWCAIPNQE